MSNRRALCPAAVPPPSHDSLVAVALAHLRRQDELAGLGGYGRVYVPDAVQYTRLSLRVVQFRQLHLGIPVYNARVSVHVDALGEPVRVMGRPVDVTGPVISEPRVTAVAAMMAAARRIRPRVGVPRLPVPEVLAQFFSPERPTVLRKPPFRDPLVAHLAFRVCEGLVRLVWVVHLALPRGRGSYEVLVAADGRRPDVLAWHSTTACAVTGSVYRTDPNEARETVAFPLESSYYSELGPLPLGFPWPWVHVASTDGNNARCYVNDTDLPLLGTRTGNDVKFEPQPDTGADQRVLNAFYVCNFLHDFFYLLGFDEKAGNFQRRNRGTEGLDNDQLIVQCFSSSDVQGAANMRSRKDGRSPELGLGLFEGRHTALDTDVVVHEYVHGVTNRMIGGLAHHDPLLNAQQSEAMGEGYSDYFALTIRNYYRRRDNRPESLTFGAWIADNDKRGWRRQSYESAVFRGAYGDLGQVGFVRPHDAGQVWCQALLAMHRGLATAIGAGPAADDQADVLGWRLVIASLPLCTPVHPTFLDGRDAILMAFDAISPGAFLPASRADLRSAVVEAFRALGMGRLAHSATAFYRDVVADFT